MRKIFTTLALGVACAAMTASAADKLMIIGDGTPGGWSFDGALLMNQNLDNPDEFTYTGYLNADGEFKFTAATDWIADMEYRNANTDPYQIDKLQVGGDDQKFKLHESGNYVVTCNLAELTVKIEKAEYQENPIRFNSLYLIGDATSAGWELPQAIRMDQDANDPYLFTTKTDLNKDGIFKIAVNPHVGYGQMFFHPEADDQTKLTDDGTDDRQWRVPENDSYIVKAHLLNKTMSIEKANSALVDVIESEETEGEVVYYNMQGVRVDNPAEGLFIKVCGNRATKVRL